MTGGPGTPPQFIAKWKAVELSERSARQSHFLDLCRVLGQPAPTDADPTGEWYTFEKGVRKDAGGQGFADVWRRGFFAREYKKKRRSLAAAYQQPNPVPGGARQPAAARRLRPEQVRGPHQLHRHVSRRA